MAVDGVSSATNTYASSSDSYENPGSVLDKDAFLQLFLEELSNQDPTSPMENEKILEQTAMLTELETNEQFKEVLEELSDVISESQEANKQFNAVSVIGKVIETDYNAISLEAGGSVDFEVYFDYPISDGTLEISNESGEVVRSVPLDEMVGQEGYIDFNWDGSGNDGSYQATGTYSIEVTYTSDSVEGDLTTRAGRGLVTSIVYEDGETLLHMGSNFVPMSEAVSITDPSYFAADTTSTTDDTTDETEETDDEETLVDSGDSDDQESSV